ncbi:MAG TPA: hypothetical protein VN025_03840 [Candidatus Dormibacteraeota bacterium]|jgi:hypothetical protein|nr:hypothetical protein [Candidatus Dormibacteraeota bacterium]
MPQITTRPEPPRGEYDFQDLCAELLRAEWKNSNLQTFGRRGQRQNGVDILDLSGARNPRGAQCKNYEPLDAILPKDIHDAVREAKQFVPHLSEFWIMTTAKKSTDSQLEVLAINEQHQREQLFTVTLKTWDEILLMFANHPTVADNWYGGGLATDLQKIEHRTAKVEEFLHALASTSASSIDRIQSRLLLRWEPKFRKTTESKDGLSFEYVADYSVVLLTIEELIAAGATELAVDLGTEDVDNLKKHIPRPLSNRIVSISPAGETGRLVGSILGPTFEEFAVEANGVASFMMNGGSTEISRHIPVIALNLYYFLLGIKNRLQIDIDLADFLTAIETVRRSSKNPQGRINLAVIEGILRSYKLLKLDCVELRPTASGRAIELFSEFVDDHHYQSISRHANSFGFPKLVAEAEREFSKIAREFVQTPKYVSDLLLGELSLSAIGPRTANDSKINEALMAAQYLPPIVSFVTARKKASSAYEILDPPPIWPTRWKSEKR